MLSYWMGQRFRSLQVRSLHGRDWFLRRCFSGAFKSQGAFTCYQMVTLVGEKLVSLLNGLPQKPWVMLLGPISPFLDEDVPEREVRPFFEKV